MMMRALLLSLMLVLAAPVMAADRSYTGDREARDRGVATLVDKMGATRPVARLSFGPDQIVATMQADSGRAFAEWAVRRVDVLVGNLHVVTGPRSVPAFDLVDDLSGAFFRLAEVDLGRFDEIVRAARDYAQLEDEPMVRSVVLERHVSILPTPAYGELRWTVTLATADESAVAYVTRNGQVIGGDLSDTKRAQNIDMLKSDDWPMAEAQAALRAVIGNAGLHDVTIYDSYVFVTANHPDDSGLERDYSWRLEGVRQGFMDTPNLIALGLGDRATFQWDEIELTALPQIKAAAREAFGAPDAVIIGIEATKPLDRAAGELQVLWEVEFRQGNGEEGAVWLDRAGKVVEVKLPHSRLPESGPWLAPESVIETIRRIGETFGPDAKISGLTINKDQATLDIEDPQRPGELAQFLMDAREVRRFGTASFFASLDAGNVFTPGELGALSKAQLSEMVRRTVERLDMPGGEVFRYTFSRHALIMDQSDNRLMVEIRYGIEEGSGPAGWMIFLLDGTQTDELIP
ncbi:MAG: hypothetical protein ACO1OG_05660 [Devosia sp.]